MRHVASTPQGREYKTYSHAALALQAGLTALDVGCGPGTDLDELAAGVSPAGSVIGLDIDPAMVDEARRFAEHRSNVEVRLGDAHAMPIESATIDRVRIDRALQHMRSPGEVLSEVRRVTAGGARVVLAEPDWATLAIDAPDLASSTAFTRYTCEHVVRNPCVGRQLARLASDAGFGIETVTPFAPAFLDYADADRILGLSRNCRSAVDAGYVPEATARQWLTALQEGPFFASVMLVTVVATAAPG
jgi:ubiquinone/menaquinone biosynthesis C-methylase UbiE